MATMGVPFVREHFILCGERRLAVVALPRRSCARAAPCNHDRSVRRPSASSRRAVGMENAVSAHPEASNASKWHVRAWTAAADLRVNFPGTGARCSAARWSRRRHGPVGVAGSSNLHVPRHGEVWSSARSKLPWCASDVPPAIHSASCEPAVDICELTPPSTMHAGRQPQGEQRQCWHRRCVSGVAPTHTWPRWFLQEQFRFRSQPSGGSRDDAGLASRRL